MSHRVAKRRKHEQRRTLIDLNREQNLNSLGRAALTASRQCGYLVLPGMFVEELLGLYWRERGRQNRPAVIVDGSNLWIHAVSRRGFSGFLDRVRREVLSIERHNSKLGSIVAKVEKRSANAIAGQVAGWSDAEQRKVRVENEDVERELAPLDALKRLVEEIADRYYDSEIAGALGRLLERGKLEPMWVELNGVRRWVFACSGSTPEIPKLAASVPEPTTQAMLGLLIEGELVCAVDPEADFLEVRFWTTAAIAGCQVSPP